MRPYWSNPGRELLGIHLVAALVASDDPYRLHRHFQKIVYWILEKNQKFSSRSCARYCEKLGANWSNPCRGLLKTHLVAALVASNEPYHSISCPFLIHLSTQDVTKKCYAHFCSEWKWFRSSEACPADLLRSYDDPRSPRNRECRSMPRRIHLRATLAGPRFHFFTRMISICVYRRISLFQQDLTVQITSYEP